MCEEGNAGGKKLLVVSDTHIFTTMILHLLVFELFNISGAQDVRTVSRVSVQEGNSIIIPCWYKQMYVNNVKYLSRGLSLVDSEYVIKSNGGVKHNSISISDNKTLNILTVEMRSVQKTQTGTYWCGIELYRRRIGANFYLQVTTGIPGLYVENQMLSGFEAGSVNISCHYHEPRRRDEKWCKLGGDCIDVSFVSFNSESVKVRYLSGLMIVTMNKLKTEDTGWYWCSVKELQIPVHITVYKRETIITTTKQMTSEPSRSPSTVQPSGTFTTQTLNSQTLSVKKHSPDRVKDNWNRQLLMKMN
nr:polymeric immunoglobulin receptor-like [Misgurnus anguillicaudatus]